MKRAPWHVLSFALLAIASFLALVSCSSPSAPTEPEASPPTPATTPVVVSSVLPPGALQRLALQPRQPAPPDSRSPEDLAQAACRSPDGAWHCPAIKPKPAVRALSAGPVIPSSWTVPAWYVDPANVTGTASDSNSCTSSVAACLTWHQINDVRWACQGNPAACPRLRQATTVNFLSSQSGTSDPVCTMPQIEVASAGSLTFTAPLPTPAGTGTLNAVTAKATASNQALASTFTGFTPAVGQLIVNTTHPSRASILRNVGAGVFLITQPITAQPSGVVSAFTEVNTWTTGDSVSVYNLTNVDLTCFLPLTNDNLGGQVATVYQVNVLDPGGLQGGVYYANSFRINDQVNLVEATGQRVAVVAQTTSAFGNYLYNYEAVGGVISAPSLATPNAALSSHTLVYGGAVAVNPGTAITNMSSAEFDMDVVIGKGFYQTYLTNGFLGAIYIDSTAVFTVAGSIDQKDNATSTYVTYGPGTFNVVGRYTYASGAGAAASTLKTTTLQSNGQTKSCIAQPGAAADFGTCNVTLSAANLDADLGATSGCLLTGGGGAFCNYGP